MVEKVNVGRQWCAMADTPPGKEESAPARDDTASSAASTPLRVVVKSPAAGLSAAAGGGAVDGQNYTCEVDAAGSVLALKQRLAADYPGRPAVEQQRLVYAGRLLRDEETLAQVVGAGAPNQLTGAQQVMVVHLVVGARARASASTQGERSSAVPTTPTPSTQTVERAAVPLPALDERTLQLLLAYTRALRAYQDYNEQLTAYYASSGQSVPPHLLAAMSGAGNANGGTAAATASAGGPPPAAAPLPAGGGAGVPAAAVPPHLRAWDGAPARVVAIRVRAIPLNWALLVKLAFLVVMFGQDADKERLVLLIGIAVLIYLYQVGMFDTLLRQLEALPTQLVARLQRARPRVTGRGTGAAASAAVAANAPPRAPAPHGWQALHRALYETYLLLVAFFCSLFPTWRPLPAAAAAGGAPGADAPADRERRRDAPP